MKIVIFNWRDIKNPWAGGAEVHLHEISKRLIKSGIKVTIISSKFPNSKDEEIIDGVKIRRTGSWYSYTIFAPLYFFIKLRKEKFDLIVEDISKVPLLIPLYDRNSIGILHHIHGLSLFRELPSILAIVVFFLEKLVCYFYRSTQLTVVSNSTKKELMKNGLLPDNIKIIFNGINKNYYKQSKKSKKPLIVYVGRVKKYKRLEHLLYAFNVVKKQIPDSKLIIAGKGDYHEKLINLKKKLELDSVEIIGEVTEKEKISILQKAWVFVSPSMKEGWGITVIEANACGTPVIAYNVPGLRDSVVDGKTGLLVNKDGDFNALAMTIIKILKNKKLIKKMSRNAYTWAKRFSWDNSAREFKKVFRGVTNAR